VGHVDSNHPIILSRSSSKAGDSCIAFRGTHLHCSGSDPALRTTKGRRA
jgi:hypothetical protein